MKKLLPCLFLFIITITPSCEEIVLTDSFGTEYTITVPEDTETLRDSYIRMTQSYLDESAEYEILDNTFNTYKKSVKESIALYQEQIEKLEHLAELLEVRISDLQNSKPPFARGYALGSINDNLINGTVSPKIGGGMIFGNKLLLQSTYSFPGELGLGIGWIF